MVKIYEHVGVDASNMPHDAIPTHALGIDMTTKETHGVDSNSFQPKLEQTA